ncbi:MAG: hypothetical protein L6R45_11870 [Anaerolineae bacterium]|nr:hypothetical protein [Anaerolineae bacterium]
MDDIYLEIILERIRVCKKYKPKFGQGQETSLEAFQKLYGADPFYSWFGLDNPLMYAAHRAAGGITSVYRQIGIGCEELFRQILQDQLELSASHVKWSYGLPTPDGKERRLALDGRFQLILISAWLNEAANQLQVAPEIIGVLKGVVFEIRQGYKSKDSKRQNANIANAATASAQGYLPVVVVLSTQIDSDVVERYRHTNWLILQGYLNDSPTHSTYAFVKNVIGYDLAGFFQRNSAILKDTIADVLRTLLTPNNGDD